MKKYNISKNHRFSSIKRNECYEGESIELKCKRLSTTKEPIKDSAPMIYTEKKDGVIQAYDVRTDRFEVALDAFEKRDASYKAKSEANISADMEKSEKIDKVESTQATDTQ